VVHLIVPEFKIIRIFQKLPNKIPRPQATPSFK